jgi:hypothetical protein
MDFKTSFLEKATSWIVGGDLYSQVKTLVGFYFTENNMSGDEKRAEVISRTKKMFIGSAGFLINLALEVAFTVLTTKVQK